MQLKQDLVNNVSIIIGVAKKKSLEGRLIRNLRFSSAQLDLVTNPTPATTQAGKISPLDQTVSSSNVSPVAIQEPQQGPDTPNPTVTDNTWPYVKLAEPLPFRA
jgi:hypothetical protein